MAKIYVPDMYPTLEEACEKAPDNAVITIKTGKYTLEKTIEISRDLTLCSETGRAEDVLIDCPHSEVFKITGGSPSLLPWAS